MAVFTRFLTQGMVLNHMAVFTRFLTQVMVLNHMAVFTRFLTQGMVLNRQISDLWSQDFHFETIEKIIRAGFYYWANISWYYPPIQLI